MTAISISLNRGLPEHVASNYTVGTAAPSAGADVEIRFNVLDQNSHAIQPNDVKRIIEAIRDAIFSPAMGVTTPWANQ